MKNRIFILGSDGALGEAYLTVKYENAVHVELSFRGCEFSRNGNSVDECLAELRLEVLEPLGMVPLINAARRNFHVSRMQKQMCRGAEGYLLRLGSGAAAVDQVAILDACDPKDVCSLTEQAVYFKSWLLSLRS